MKHIILKSIMFIATATMVIAIPFAGSSAVAAEESMTDEDITAAVETELIVDAVVPYNDIMVETNAGVVSLDGTVNNMLAKERAARIARAVRGVRSVVNQILVVPAEAKSGRQLEHDVKQALLTNPATDSYEVHVEADDDGAVTLKGDVQSWAEHELVRKVASGVAGVTDVDNQIMVEFDGNRSDAELEAEVKQRLEWDVLVDAQNISVTSKDGKVELTGLVSSAAERHRAMQRAWTTGVVSVEIDDLQVATTPFDQNRRDAIPTPPDGDVETAIEDALLFDPRVNKFDVAVSVKHGVATLRGSVDNLHAKWAAERDAENTVGVARVRNLIRVQSGLNLADKIIESDIGEMIMRDPFLQEREIDVDVTSGVARLTGTVETYFEKGHAEDLASAVEGVINVINMLGVERLDTRFLYDPYVDTWLPPQRFHSFRMGEPAKDDVTIKSEIRDQLWWSPFVDSDKVKVDVNNGVVTLTGTVDSWSERRAAENNAFDGGAVWVKNRLEVASQ